MIIVVCAKTLNFIWSSVYYILQCVISILIVPHVQNIFLDSSRQSNLVVFMQINSYMGLHYKQSGALTQHDYYYNSLVLFLIILVWTKWENIRCFLVRPTQPHGLVVHSRRIFQIVSLKLGFYLAILISLRNILWLTKEETCIATPGPVMCK